MLKCDQVPTVCTLAAGTVVGITHMVLLFSLPETSKARIVLLVDLQAFFSDLGMEWGGEQKKSSKNDQLTGHFKSFF